MPKYETKDPERKRRFGQTYAQRYESQKKAVIEIRAKYRLLATIEGLQTYTDMRNYFHAGERLRWMLKGTYEWIYLGDDFYFYYKDILDRYLLDKLGRVPEHWKRKDPRFWKPFDGAGYFQPEVKTDLTTPLSELLPKYEGSYPRQFWNAGGIRGDNKQGKRKGEKLRKRKNKTNTTKKDVHAKS